MKLRILLSAFAASLLFSLSAQAQTAPTKPAPAPAATTAPKDATGQCNDGSYWTNPTKAGACRGHQGVKTWFATDSAATPAAKSATKPAATVAPGGGPGIVWVNTSTKVYHCQGDRYYGTTKDGKYMSEADAKAMGGKVAGGKACPK